MLSLESVTKRYGKRLVLEQVDLEITPGLTLLVGPSGAGKSTLLRLCATAEPPSSGSISWDGEPLPRARRALRRSLGFAPQVVDLPEDLTGLEFLDYVASLKGLRRGSQARELLVDLGLGTDAERRISTYSGGMRRRLILAQALLGSPRLLALDEPTAELDSRSGERVRALVRNAARDAAVVVSTHLTAHFSGLAARVLTVADGRVTAG